MNRILRPGIACLLLAAAGITIAEPENRAEQNAAECLECHDFGPESPVHDVLSGSHGIAGDADEMSDRRGCKDCHGDSAAHSGAPTQNAPAVSFGPRWSASSDAQDSKCLACHGDGKAENWQHSLHMLDNLTCVTCHDIHTEQDRILDPSGQAEVCTVCHKVQKKGIHAMERRASRNPPCTDCHNPHDHETAEAEMLANQSAGCSTCHDLVRMAGRSSVSDKAKSYHKVMARPGRTCLDCHQGIAHAATDGGPGGEPTPLARRTLTLFYPGMADSEWLLQQHPGSQPLRQGAPCQRCHRGEEASIGVARGGDLEPASRDIDITFARQGDQLLVTLQWRGDENDRTVSLMWADDSNQAFTRGGCFAACHSDLPGMSRNRGQQIDKYLPVSRVQQPALGRPAILRPEPELEELLYAGQFAELWQVELASGSVRHGLLLAKLDWQEENLIWVNKTFTDGRWEVALRRNLDNTSLGLDFDQTTTYTFGIALNRLDNPGAKHWVSLPKTLSFGKDNTDFTAE